MKHGNRIITLFLAVAIAFVFCVPTLITPAHAVSLNQAASDTSITLNNGDVLRVPSEAISGNFIVYRVNNGAYRYYVIDVFESTDGVKELAFLSFTRYVGQSAITNANALSSNAWTIFGMQNVLYAISGAITVRSMYSTFDYYDALGFLLIGGVGTEHTEDEFAGTFEVSTPDYTFRLPRELMGSQFMIVNGSSSTSLDTIQVYEFPDFIGVSIAEGDIHSYNRHYISDIDVTLRVSYEDVTRTVSFPEKFDYLTYPYWYATITTSSPSLLHLWGVKTPAFSNDSHVMTSDSMGYVYAYYDLKGDSWLFTFKNYSGSKAGSGTKQHLIWSNADIYNSITGELSWSFDSSCISHCVRAWSSEQLSDQIMSFEQDPVNILYSTFDYYGADGSLYYGNSFAGEVTEDDSLIDLTLDDGAVIRVPEHFGERDAHYVVMDPVGGTEETAYLIYEFDYYEGVADGTICDFTRWYGVFSDGVWSWNYQEYYVTELDILDYGPIVYSTFEYVDGRVDEEEPPGSGGATSEEVKGFWNKLMAKLEEILKAIKGIGGTDLSISIENNTIIDAADKDPFDPEVYKGVVKTLRNSVKLFTGFFGFIYDGVNNFIDFLTDTSSEFYGIFHVNGMG